MTGWRADCKAVAGTEGRVQAINNSILLQEGGTQRWVPFLFSEGEPALSDLGLEMSAERGTS